MNELINMYCNLSVLEWDKDDYSSAKELYQHLFTTEPHSDRTKALARRLDSYEYELDFLDECFGN